jgi:hypothetical protein
MWTSGKAAKTFITEVRYSIAPGGRCYTWLAHTHDCHHAPIRPRFRDARDVHRWTRYMSGDGTARESWVKGKQERRNMHMQVVMSDEA